MRYVLARFESEFQTKAYRIFVTDYLKSLGRFQGQRYYDVLATLQNRVTSNGKEKTSEEIITNVKQKLTRIGGDRVGRNEIKSHAWIG